jgi:hypothetical protein
MIDTLEKPVRNLIVRKVPATYLNFNKYILLNIVRRDKNPGKHLISLNSQPIPRKFGIPKKKDRKK